MSAIESHYHILNEAQWLVSSCPKCKCTPQLQYEPGVTFAECKCRTHAIAEENYKALARQINVVHEPRLKGYKFR